MQPSAHEPENEGSLDFQLSVIRRYIEDEIAGKQAVIIRLEERLQERNMLLLQKNAELADMQKKLADSQQNIEGQRQLMNKLLNDIGNYRRDLLWYRRTYEQRSLLGILKDKFFRKSSASENDNF